MKTISFTELTHFIPKQDEALQASKKYKYVLYGGTMGSGKSYFLRWCAIYWLLYLASKYNQQGIRVGLFCEDYGSLNDRHISKIKMEFPKGLGVYNEQRHEFTLHYRFGSGVIAFRNLDDPSKYVSSEFAAIFVDEINRNPYSMFSILRTRLRWAGIAETKFLAACNPVGEPWVKRYWIDRNFPPEEKEQEQFFFVQALPKDNPHLSESYYQALDSLDEKEKKAYLEGDWNAFEGEMDEEGWMKLLTDHQFQDAISEKPDHFGEGVIGVDPAAGGDRSAVVYKSEMLQEVVFSQKLNDVLQLIPVIARAISDYGNVKEIVIDRTGVGEGLYRRCKELEKDLKVRVRGVAYAESPSSKERFENLKAELYWKERDWLLHGGKLKKHQGWNDFINIKYKIYNGKVIRIQSKDDLRKQGFKSPDTVDAAVLTQAASRNLKFDDMYKQITFKDRIKDIWAK